MHYIYVAKCADGTFYTGYTTNPDRRIEEHNTSKKGAKYTKTRRPVELVYTETYETKQEAMSREWFIHKKMSRKEKEQMMKNWLPPKLNMKKGDMAVTTKDIVLVNSTIPKGTVVRIDYAGRFSGYDIVSVEDERVWATEVPENELEKVDNTYE